MSLAAAGQAYLRFRGRLPAAGCRLEPQFQFLIPGRPEAGLRSQNRSRVKGESEGKGNENGDKPNCGLCFGENHRSLGFASVEMTN